MGVVNRKLGVCGYILTRTLLRVWCNEQDSVTCFGLTILSYLQAGAKVII